MKKLNILLLTTMTFLIMSCGVNPTKLMSNVMDKVYIGMPISEFKEKIENEEVVEMNSEVTIYKVEIKNYNDLHGWRKDHRFFYFENNKLKKDSKHSYACANIFFFGNS